MFRNCSMLSLDVDISNIETKNNSNAQHFHVKHRISGAFRFFWQTWIPDVFLKRITFLLLKKSWGDDVGWHRSPFTEKTIGHDMNRCRSFKIEICVRVLQICSKSDVQIWCSPKKLEGFIFVDLSSLVFFSCEILSKTQLQLWGSNMRIPLWNGFLNTCETTGSSGSSCMFFFQ